MLIRVGKGGLGTYPYCPQLCARHRARCFSQGAHFILTTAVQGGAAFSFIWRLRALVQGPQRVRDPRFYSESKPAQHWLCLWGGPSLRRLYFTPGRGCLGLGNTQKVLSLAGALRPPVRFTPRVIRSYQDASSPSTYWPGGDSARFKDLPFRVIHLVSSGWRQRTQVQMQNGKTTVGVAIPKPN